MPFSTSNIRHHARTYNLDGEMVVSLPDYDYVANAPVYATDFFTFDLRDIPIGPGTPQFPIVIGDHFGMYFKSANESDYDSFHDWVITGKSGSEYSFSKSYAGFRGYTEPFYHPPGYLPNPSYNNLNVSMGGYRDFSQRYFSAEKPEDFPFGDWDLKVYHASNPADLPGEGDGTVNFFQFPMRGIAITNLKSTPERIEVDGVVQKVTITGDITVYPNMDTHGIAGWTPEFPIDWKVMIKADPKLVSEDKWIVADTTAPGSTYLPVIPTAPNSAGVVGSFSMEWDGTFTTSDGPPYDTEEAPFIEMAIEARAMVQTSSSPVRNTISPLATNGVRCKKCENTLIDLYLSLMFLIALFGEDGPVIPMGHNSNESMNPEGSMGYGWFSTENIKVVDISEEQDKTDLVYCDEAGMTRRWVKDDGGNFVPVLPDNQISISHNAGGGNATYVVTWRGMYRREFNASGALRREVDRNGRSTTYTRSANYLKVSDDKGRDVYMHFNPGEGQPIVINDNPSPTLGRGQRLEYYLEEGVQKQLRSISVPMDLAAPVPDKTVFVYNPEGRIQEQREETTNHHRSVHYVYDISGAGRLASKRVTSTLLHPTDPLLNEVTEHSLESYEYQVPFSYGGVDYITTQIVTEDLQNSDDPEQEKALTRTFHRAYDSLSRILGEFEYVEDDDNNESVYVATLHEYNDPSDPLSVSSDPWLRTRTFQVNKETETLFEYTPRGNVKKVTNKKVSELTGDETLFTYVEEDPTHDAYENFKDLVTEVRRPAPDRAGAPSVFYPATKFTYDPANGNLVQVEDAKGESSYFRYNLDGQVSRIINRRGFKTYMEYDGRARLTKIHSQKSVNPSPTIEEYINENAADFRTVEMEYDIYDNLTSTEDANGNTVGMVYDARNRPTTITDGNDVERVFTYLNGVLDQVTLPDSSGHNGLHTDRVSKTQIDSAGRTVAVLRQDSEHQEPQMRVGFAHDGFSQLRSLIRIKNNAEKAHRTEYDRQGRTVKSIDANGKESTASYAPFCKEYATTSARGIRTRSQFDEMCRLTNVIVGDPDLTDPEDREVANVRETRVFEYDDLGRLLKTSQTGATGSVYGQAVFGSSTYGATGGPAEEREFQYNELDQLTKVIFEDDKEMEYFHDEEGNVIRVVENASGVSKTTRFSYYGDNRLHQVTYVRGVDEVDSQTFTYDYDAGGRPSELEYPLSTGIKALFSGPTGQVGWDGNGQLKHLRYVKGGTNLVHRFEYDYDLAGNRTMQFDITPTKVTYWSYSYDWLDRLEAVKKVETTDLAIIAQVLNMPAADALPLIGSLQLVSVYEYDAADNRIKFEVPQLGELYQSFYDSADNITRVEKSTNGGPAVTIEIFTSDDDGNLKTRTQMVDGVPGEKTTYTWTDFNRLAAMEKRGADGTVLQKQSHTFGVSGFRRKKKDKNNVETTEYAGGLETAVSKAQAGETITYLMGHRLMGFERSSDGAMFWFLCDALSTVRDIVNSSGVVVASYEFSEYGQQLPDSMTNTVGSQKAFVGGLSVQDEVADTGLMMMGHRFYEPNSLGRFISRDPKGFRGGGNLFEYAASNPTQSVDPEGLLEVGDWISAVTGQPRVAAPPITEGELRVYAAIMGIINEPFDWVMTGEDIYENGFQPHHLLGLLPFVSYGVAKGLDRYNRVRSAAAAREGAYLTSCAADGIINIQVVGHPYSYATLFVQDEVLTIAALYRGSLGRGAGPELLKIALEHVPNLPDISRIILGDVLHGKSKELLKQGVNPTKTSVYRAVAGPVEQATGKFLINAKASVNRSGNYDISADLL